MNSYPINNCGLFLIGLSKVENLLPYRATTGAIGVLRTVSSGIYRRKLLQMT
jgi:hypothetical protein